MTYPTRRVQKLPSAKVLRETFDYDDGRLIWKKTTNPSLKGRVAGSYNEGHGEHIISIKGVRTSRKRLVWKFFENDEPYGITRINPEDRHRDRIENLHAMTDEEVQSGKERVLEAMKEGKGEAA